MVTLVFGRGAAALLVAAIVLIVVGGFALAYNPDFDPATWDGTPRISPSPAEFGHTADEIYGLKEFVGTGGGPGGGAGRIVGAFTNDAIGCKTWGDGVDCGVCPEGTVVLPPSAWFTGEATPPYVFYCITTE